ncbi:MAG TPA: hypothetical protein VGJ20_06915 [Xanthobacteraceae bacterium]
MFEDVRRRLLVLIRSERRVWRCIAASKHDPRSVCHALIDAQFRYSSSLARLPDIRARKEMENGIATGSEKTNFHDAGRNAQPRRKQLRHWTA